MLEEVKLGEAGGVRAGAYSGGMKRRLSVAIALLGDPQVGWKACRICASQQGRKHGVQQGWEVAGKTQGHSMRGGLLLAALLPTAFPL